jgi:hypothetical protein
LWLISLIFLLWISEGVPLNLQTWPMAAPYWFGRHFIFVFPQQDVITLNIISLNMIFFIFNVISSLHWICFFHIQHYDVTQLNIMPKLHIWSAIELIWQFHSWNHESFK